VSSEDEGNPRPKFLSGYEALEEFGKSDAMTWTDHEKQKDRKALSLV
jgi:hypothetical protein